MTGRRVSLVGVVGLMVVSLVACNSAKLGQQQQSSQVRYYNNAQYGTLAVFDYGGIVNPNPGSPVVGPARVTIGELQAQRIAAGLPPWQCIAGMTGLGIGLVGVLGLPEDAPVYLGAVLWTGVGADFLGTTDSCWNTWKQSIAFDAFSRWLFACGDSNGFFGAFLNAVSLGSCNTMGWVSRQVMAHPELFSYAEVKSITMCSTLIQLPLTGYDCLDG